MRQLVIVSAFVISTIGCSSGTGVDNDAVVEDLAAHVTPEASSPARGGGKSDHLGASIPGCPGITYNFDDDFGGFAGTYFLSALADPGQPSSLTLSPGEPVPESIATSGPFTGFIAGDSGLPQFVSGEWYGAPSNPAIGSVLGFHAIVAGEETWSVFPLVGITRSSFTGSVRSLCLWDPTHDEGMLFHRLGF